jgi:hypothetical protein
MSFSDALFISPSAAMTIANENGRRGSTFGLEESPMKDLNSHGYDEGLEGGEEEVVGGLKPETPKRTTRSAGPSPSPGLVAAAEVDAIGNELVSAGDLTSAPRLGSNESPHVETQTATPNGNEDTTSDTLNTPNVPDSSPPVTVEAVTRRDIDLVPSEPEQAVLEVDLPPVPSADDRQHFRSIIAGVTEEPIKSEIETAEPDFENHQEETEEDATEQEGTKQEHLHIVPSAEDQQHFRSVIAGVTEGPSEAETESTEPKVKEPEQLPPIPAAEDQQHFRSIIAGVTEGPTTPKVKNMDQEITESESKIVDHHTIGSNPETTNDETTTMPATTTEQLTSTSKVLQHVDQEESDIPGSNLAEDRSTTPLADRQQHMRAILAGVVDDETTDLNSTEMEATVPSTDAEDPSLTPPFVTPMTFIDDIEPTYPETNEDIHSTPIPKATDNETKPLEARDGTAL